MAPPSPRKAQQARRRLEAGQEQDEHGTHEIAVAQALPVHLGIEQITDEVVSGLSPALLEEDFEVLLELSNGNQDLRPPLRGRGRVNGDETFGPETKSVEMFPTETEQVGDDGPRQRQGQFLADVHFSSAYRTICEGARDVTGKRLDAGQDVRREGVCNESANGGVPRGIEHCERIASAPQRRFQDIVQARRCCSRFRAAAPPASPGGSSEIHGPSTKPVEEFSIEAEKIGNNDPGQHQGEFLAGVHLSCACRAIHEGSGDTAGKWLDPSQHARGKRAGNEAPETPVARRIVHPERLGDGIFPDPRRVEKCT